MSIGFRKSLFGFNCDDVIDYVEKTHKRFKIKTDELTQKTEELNTQLNLSKEAYNNLLIEKNEISKKLEAFTGKVEEIERLSENIGKLYLVSQSNAQAVMASAEESSTLANLEVEKNLSAIDEAHASLQALRENITKTSDNFIAEVESMLASLDLTRQQIELNTQKSNDALEDFQAVYESIINE